MIKGDTARNGKKFQEGKYYNSPNRMYFQFYYTVNVSFQRNVLFPHRECVLLTSTNAKLSTGEFSQAWQEIFLSNYQFLLLRQGDDLLLYTWDTPRYENR